jgi:hypothetical protein
LKTTALLVASASWSIAIMRSIFEMLAAHGTSPYAAVQFAVCAAGLVGCVGWALASSRWGYVVAAAAAGYLLVYLFRYFFVRVSGFSGIMSVSEALWWPIYSTWALIVSFLAHGRIAAGLGLLVEEWLVPLLQLAVFAAAVRTLTARSPGDVAQAARA